jgi:hypothetical protein
MNSKYYLVISDSMIQRSPQITSSLIEFISVCIGITFLPQATQTQTHTQPVLDIVLSNSIQLISAYLVSQDLLNCHANFAFVLSILP